MPYYYYFYFLFLAEWVSSKELSILCENSYLIFLIELSRSGKEVVIKPKNKVEGGAPPISGSMNLRPTSSGTVRMFMFMFILFLIINSEF